jgi:hypothetical protein
MCGGGGGKPPPQEPRREPRVLLSRSQLDDLMIAPSYQRNNRAGGYAAGMGASSPQFGHYPELKL